MHKQTAVHVSPAIQPSRGTPCLRTVIVLSLSDSSHEVPPKQHTLSSVAATTVSTDGARPTAGISTSVETGAGALSAGAAT
jgi:hypothetical protein